MSQVGRVEREWHQYDRVDGAWDLEAGYFQDDVWSGDTMLLASPNQAPELALGTNAHVHVGQVRELGEAGALDGLLSERMRTALFEDDLGDFNDGGADLTIALTEQQIDLLADLGDAEELAGGTPYEDVGSNWESYLNRSLVTDSLHEHFQEGADGIHDPAEVEAFMDRIAEESDNPDSQVEYLQEYFAGKTMEDFGDRTSIERELMVQLRASELVMNNRNPWEILTLVDAVQDDDERTSLMRELFEHIEDLPVNIDPYTGRYDINLIAPGAPMTNMATLTLLQRIDQAGDQVGPAARTMLESGVRLDLVDERAADYAQDHVAEPLAENDGDWQATIDGLLQDHIYGEGLGGQSGDKISDNFQAVWQVGGPERVSQMVETIGEATLESWLTSVLRETPAAWRSTRWCWRVPRMPTW